MAAIIWFTDLHNFSPDPLFQHARCVFPWLAATAVFNIYNARAMLTSPPTMIVNVPSSGSRGSPADGGVQNETTDFSD